MAKKLFTKKNIIRFIAVVLIVGLATTALKYKMVKDSMSEVSSIIPTGTRTTVLQKTSIYDTITVSGTIKSVQTVNVTEKIISR